MGYAVKAFPNVKLLSSPSSPSFLNGKKRSTSRCNFNCNFSSFGSSRRAGSFDSRTARHFNFFVIGPKGLQILACERTHISHIPLTEISTKSTKLFQHLMIALTLFSNQYICMCTHCTHTYTYIHTYVHFQTCTCIHIQIYKYIFTLPVKSLWPPTHFSTELHSKQFYEIMTLNALRSLRVHENQPRCASQV